MKKIISIILIFVLLIVCLGCEKKDDKIFLGETIDIEYFERTLSSFASFGTDLFTGKVLSKTPLDKGFEFPSIEYQDEDVTPYLYKVEVIQNIWTVTTQEKTVIDVVRCVSPNPQAAEYWSESYEVGKTYLICGDIQPYNKKAVVFDIGSVTSCIDGDKLIPIGSESKRILEGIDSLSAFVERDEVKQVFEKNKRIIDGFFYAYAFDDIKAAVSGEEYPYDTKITEKLIEKLQGAILSENTVKLDTVYNGQN